MTGENSDSAGPCRVLVADDEPLARLRIVKYLREKHPEMDVREARDGLDALEQIRQSPPDVLFLDIEMPAMTGLELLQQLPERQFQVIFQTAYNEFAIKAFDENACDYLLKPFPDDRLERAIQKALQARGSPPSPAVSQLMDHLVVKEKRYLQRIAIRVGSRMRIVETDEIIYFLSEQHVTRVFLEGVDFVYDQSLSYLESRLDPEVFQRIHRNAIVKLAAIASFRAGEIVLRNGVHLSVSRERSKALRALFKGESPAGS